jgi:phosphohistidine phosphatase
VVVGHLPFLVKVAALLVAGDQDAIFSSFRPGTAVCLERTDSGRWTINWMIRPELLTA